MLVNVGWEVVDEVEPICPITFKPLGVTLVYCSNCYVMLVDEVWVSEIHDRCEIVN